MARNRYYEEADAIPMPVPEGTESGDALVIGGLPCVATTDRRSDGKASVDCDGAYLFDVRGNDGSPAAIDAGDIVYLDGGVISSDSGGGRFGYALAPVSSGATTEIPVKIGY